MIPNAWICYNCDMADTPHINSTFWPWQIRYSEDRGWHHIQSFPPFHHSTSSSCTSLPQKFLRFLPWTSIWSFLKRLSSVGNSPSLLCRFPSARTTLCQEYNGSWLNFFRQQNPLPVSIPNFLKPPISVRSGVKIDQYFKLPLNWMCDRMVPYYVSKKFVVSKPNLNRYKIVTVVAEEDSDFLCAQSISTQP